MGAQLEQAAIANVQQMDLMTGKLDDTNMKAQRLWSMHVGVRQELQEHLEQYIRVISYLMKETQQRLAEEADRTDKADEHEESPTSLLMFWTEKAEKPKSPLRLELEKLLVEYSSAASTCKERLTTLQVENSKIVAAFA